MSRTKGARSIRDPDRARLREQIARLYESGLTVAEAAAECQVAYATAYALLLEAEVPRRRPHESRRMPRPA